MEKFTGSSPKLLDGSGDSKALYINSAKDYLSPLFSDSHPYAETASLKVSLSL